MRTTVNPGSYLELLARLEIVPASHGQPAVVLERDTGAAITLAGLLASFRQDPSDNVIGSVRITIVPAA